MCCLRFASASVGPLVVNLTLNYSISTISLASVGHLGTTELAAAALVRLCQLQLISFGAQSQSIPCHTCSLQPLQAPSQSAPSCACC